MELIYSWFKSILSINIILLLFFPVELWKMIKHYIKVKKYGGNRIEVFRYKSSMKSFSIVIFILSTIFNFWIMKRGNMANFIIFQLFLILILVQGIGKIIVYENGIYHQGRFVRWKEMKSIRKTQKSSIMIEIKDTIGAIMLNKVIREEELIQLLKENTPKILSNI